MTRARGEVAGFFLYSLGVTFFAGVIGLLVARLLGPAERGALASIYTAATTVLAICLVSLSDALSFELRRNPGSQRELFSASLALTAGYGAIGAVVTYAIVSQLAVVSEGAVPLLAGAFVLVSSLGTVSLSTFIGLADFGTTNRLRLVGPIALLVLLAGSAWLASTPIGVKTVLACYLASEVVAFATIGWRASQRVGIATAGWGTAAACLVRTGVRLHPTTLMGIAGANLDKFWIIAIATSHDIGLYVVAMTLASAIIGAVASAVFTVWLPRLQALSGEQRTDAFVYLLAMALVTLAIVAVGGAAVSPWLVPLLFGRDYASAGPVGSLLFFACMLLATRQIAHRCIRAYEDFRTGGWSELSYLAAFALAATFLPVESPLHRVALAFLFGNLVSFAATLILVGQTVCLPVTELIGRIAGSTPAAAGDLTRRVAAFATRPRS